jgi:lysophospholipase L1-like esterase
MVLPRHKQRGRPSGVGRAKRLVYSLIPAVLLFGSAEIGLRVLRLPREKYRGQKFHFPTEDLYRTALRRDAHRFWRLAPNYDGPWQLDHARAVPAHNREPNGATAPVADRPTDDTSHTVTWEVNEAGFRGPLHDPDKRLILFLGSSVTFGWGVPADDCFAGLVRQRLAGHGYDDWDVINAGVPGYTSHQCLRYLEEIQDAMHPEIIILECGINDGIWAPGLSDRDITVAEDRGWGERIIESSNLLLTLAYLAHGGTRDAGTEAFDPTRPFYHSRMYVPGRSRVSEAEFKSNLRSIEQQAAAHNARVFFIFPGLYNEYGAGKLVKAVRFSHANEIEIVAPMNALPASDLSEYFLPHDEAHLSVKGHRFVAELIWQKLTQGAEQAPLSRRSTRTDGGAPDAAMPRTSR